MIKYAVTLATANRRESNPQSTMKTFDFIDNYFNVIIK
jgi:hypothetical protein